MPDEVLIALSGRNPTTKYCFRLTLSDIKMANNVHDTKCELLINIDKECTDLRQAGYRTLQGSISRV